MRYRIAMLAVAVAAVVASLGTGSAVAAGPKPATPESVFGTSVFKLTGDQALCIITHGVGHQLTVTDTGGCAEITLYQLGTSGNFTFTDANGNCIRANSSDVVLVESGACNTNDTAEIWSETFINPWRFENLKQLLWLKTFGFNSGDKVWVGTGGENDWCLPGILSC